MAVLAEFSPISLAVLAALVFFAGIVDALAGGGGLITLPAYLAVGLPPALLLGTNKCSSSVGTIMSVYQYSRRLKLKLQGLLPAVLAALLGAAAGARLALSLDPSFMRGFLLIALPITAYAVYSKHGFSPVDISAEFSPRQLALRSLAIALPLGLYDGFFGPGTGTFLALGYSRLCGYDALQSTARAKVINLSTNLAALAAFLLAGKVHVALGLSMGLLSVGGHWAGSHLGIKNGARAIRPMILAVCAALFLKIALDVFAAPAHGGELAGQPVWLLQTVRQAYIDRFRADPEDPTSKATADFLAASETSLFFDDLGYLEEDDNDQPFAIFDPGRRAIALDAGVFAKEGFSIDSVEADPAKLKPFIDRTAAILLHEVRHARDMESLGFMPDFFEVESAAYLEEGLYVRRRLERGDGYDSLTRADAVFRRLAGLPAAEAAAWWKDPLPKGKPQDWAALMRQACKEASVSSLDCHELYLVRSLAGGFQSFQRQVWAVLTRPSVFAPPPEGRGIDLKDLALTRNLLKQIRAGTAEQLKGRERALVHRERMIVATADFWAHPERLKAAQERFREVRRAQKARLEALNP